MNQHIESALTDELRELAGQQPSRLDIDAVIRRGRVLRRRRLAVPAAGAAALTAGAVAVGLVAGGVPGSAQPGSPAHRGIAADSPPSRQAATRLPSARALTVRLAAAYSAARASSEVTDFSTFSGGSTVDTVTDPSQKWSETITKSASGATQSVVFTEQLPGMRRRPLTVYNGQNQKETLKGPFWVFETVRIDYATHRYYIDKNYAGRQAGQSLSPARVEKDADASLFVVPQPESLKTSTWSKVAGTATVDGQATYVLDQTGSGGVTATTWVSQRTLLPVRDVVHSRGGTSTDAYTYATAAGSGATAAANTPKIPAGFTKG
jgi:hypothetical protein